MSQEGLSSSLNSSDRSQYYRELTEALALSDSSATLKGKGNTCEMGESGDATLTQLMQTMYSSEPKQKIVLPGRDENEHSFCVFGREVDIYVASVEDGPRPGSNKVKITPVVNHAWEHKYYFGNLVAVHHNADFVAFALKGKTGGNVRILSRRTAQRELLKGFAGNVLDVAFAHSDTVTLAAVDETGNVHVYNCAFGNDGKIITDLVLHLDPGLSKPSAYHRVVWCPYWPEDSEEGEPVVDSSKVFAFTQGQKIDLLQLDMVTRDYGAGPLNPADIESGRLSLATHTEPIVDAVFSPDGSALATASLDGYVKFFEVNWQSPDGEPARCLHQWQPHNGEPLSFFAFLDDLRNMSADAQFWKFAVTGCNRNQELKVWSCETWTCLQTLHFLAPPVGRPLEPPCLKACIDPTAKYLVLSDKGSMVMYVLQLYQDPAGGTAHISSVSEFPLTQPCLSFAILEACTKRFKQSPNDSHLDEITTGEVNHEEDTSQNFSDTADDNPETTGVQIRLYAVHTRALQELLIRFRPVSSVSALGSAGSISHDGTSLRDGLSDMSVSMGGENSFMETDVTDDVTGDELLPDASPQLPASGPMLLTPVTFSLAKVKTVLSPSSAANTTVATTDDVLSSTSSFTHVTGLTGQNAEDLLLSPASSAGHYGVAASTPAKPRAAAATQSPQASVHSLQSSLHSPKSGVQSPGSVSSPKSAGSGLYSWQQTPVGGRELELDEDLTPTNIPLPPEEENELATPKGSSSLHSQESTQVDALEAFFNPRSSATSSLPVGDSVPGGTGTFEIESLKSSAEVNTVSASAEAYDENDQEVAEVLGEDLNASDSSGPELAGPSADYSVESVPLEDDRPHKPWPRAPDVTAPAQLSHAASSVQAHDESVMTGNVEAEDNFSDDQATEAEVEEEIEEVVEEAEDEVDNAAEEEEEGGGGEKTFRKLLQDMEEQDEQRGRGPVHVIREVVDRSMLLELQEGLSKLGDAVVQQQVELRGLKQQLREQHSLHLDLQRQQLEQAALHSATMPGKELEQQLGRVENVVVSKVERTMTSALQKEMKILHDKLQLMESRQFTAFENLQRGMMQSMTSAAQKALDNIVRAEFKQNVVPAVTRSIEQLKNQLHSEVAQKITATDSVIKDQIGKIVRSKQTAEAIGVAVAGAIQAPMQNQLREVFQQRVAPAFEHSTQTLANQVNTAFQDGTREYTAQLRKHLEKLRLEQQAAQDPVVAQFNSLLESFKQNTQQLHTQVIQTLKAETSVQVKASLSSLQEQLSSGLRAAIHEEVASAMHEQGNKMTDSLATYLRSGAATPVPTTPDLNSMQALQEQIKSLVNRGRVNDAFITALQQSKLELTVFTCELVDPNTLFSASPCPLSQPVILSLIQQLSAELNTHFDTKLSYLTEAIASLDPTDPVTQEHVPAVIDLLINKLRTYQASNPPNREVRKLLMAATGLKKAG